MLRLSEEVAERRRELNISQAELARRASVHQTMISAIERGKKSPTIDLLVRLQDALGIPLIPLPPATAPTTEPETQAVQQ